MEYMILGVEFFANKKGVKWRLLRFCTLMQFFFVSLVIILSASTIFKNNCAWELTSELHSNRYYK